MEAAILKRLEAATARLEELARRGGVAAVGTGPASSSGSGSVSAAAHAQAAPASGSAAAGFDALLTGAYQTYQTLSQQIGGLVAEQAAAVAQGVTAQRHLIATASASKKPGPTEMPTLLKPIQSAIERVIALKDQNRASPHFFHLSAVADGIGALGWVIIEPAPAPYVGEMKSSAQFYANRVIKEQKEKEPKHVEWVNAYVEFLEELQAYVKQTHTTGLTWNPAGGVAQAAHAAQVAAASAAQTASSAVGAAVPAVAGFLSGLGANVTAGLKKVAPEQMTHKNPELRGSSVVKAREESAGGVTASAPSAAAAAAAKKPPVFRLEGNKWLIEHQVNNNDIVVENAEINQTVYIFGCQNSTVQVRGKVNAVILDGSRKVGLVVENVLSTVETINCKSCQIQINGIAPTVNIDKTDGLQLYISQANKDVQILTAKSSEMNVLIQGADGEYAERPVCEQYKTTIDADGNLLTVPVVHKG
ncbi:hypothetical protein CXG81DRAFT_29124 [Caulochytrium protostelioides]|uniref:Adenylyl cyclase-associated protein n=1 Tax=Caulochytrium protostelioides TaxID=1555241 RepID=A0A4P9XEJ2_9FUNG|nr:hypothetical protein CXG81DRAFT_29124 [Caulochytrium protostelioides]|eukprot:RKP03964.1 hypothetical protein CXG81DRAFT_29124 [Caulochytrium protostelioides]